MTIRLDRRVLLTIAVVIGGLWLPSPGAARAQDKPAFEPWVANLRYAGEFAGFRLGGTTYHRLVAVSDETVPSPDIVIFSPGGILPPPQPCIQPDPNTIRCPILNLQSLEIQFGSGNDRLDTTRFDSPAQTGFELRFRMGEGNDRFAGGPLDEDWFGGPGSDFAKAGAGNDRMIAGSGNDRMFGDLGIDFFLGQAGRDFARGGPGNDRGNGGPGEDNFRD